MAIFNIEVNRTFSCQFHIS